MVAVVRDQTAAQVVVLRALAVLPVAAIAIVVTGALRGQQAWAARLAV